MSSQTKNGKVFVGLSGGVDSSVSAALLQKAGYDVTGVFIKTWTPDWLKCSWKEDRLDAMRVSAALGIPFRELDLEKEYKREVVDYMIREYRGGRTPNPDVFCNRYIKFGAFFNWAIAEGVDFVATGHYARIARVESLKLKVERKTLKSKDLKLKSYNLQLLAGKDKNKDQSYFLWTLTQKQLAKTLFPVGGMEKPEVRKLAKKFGLPTAEKKDSQGLCFMGKVDVKDFLAHYIKPKRGKVLNERGEEIGWHGGATFLTIGERRGFTITKKTPNDKPYFIVSKNVKKNTVTVAHRNPSGVLPTATTEVTIKDVNWICRPVLEKTGVCFTNTRCLCAFYARVRYRQPLQSCSLTQTSPCIRVTFEEPQIVAPGQSLVIYDKKGNELIGGGIIE